MSDINLITAIDILEEANRQGVKITYSQKELMVNVLKNTTVDSRLLDKLRVHKELLIRYFERREQNKVLSFAYDPITAKDRHRAERASLSFSQERLWLIDQIEGSIHYHVPMALRIKGDIDPDLLAAAIRKIIDRHDILRTVIKEEGGELYQQVIDAEGWDMHVHDRASDLPALIEELVRWPFDLSRDYMIRAHVIRIEPCHHVLVITMHHIASDGLSMPILYEELLNSYIALKEGRDPALPILKLQYSDYAIWQRKQLSGSRFDAKLKYWMNKLKGVMPFVLTAGHAIQDSKNAKGQTISVEIDKLLAGNLRELSNQSGVTMFMTLISAFKVLLFRYSGHEDICIGIPVSGREQEEVKHLIGCFINIIALRSTVQKDATFSELLAEMKKNILEAYEYQDVPFEKIISLVRQDRDMAQNPVFRIIAGYQNDAFSNTEMKLPGVVIGQEPFETHTSKFDIGFSFIESGGRLFLNIEYRTDMYSEMMMRRLSGNYVELLKSVVRDPLVKVSEMAVISPEEHRRLMDLGMAGAGDGRHLTGETSFSRRLYSAIKSSLGANAISHAGKEISYEQLATLVDRFSFSFRELKLVKGNRVAVHLDRSQWVLVSLLSILREGLVYIPIDKNLPKDRIAFVLNDTKPDLIILDTENPENKLLASGYAYVTVPALLETQTFNDKDMIECNSHDPACIIYTSGSAGRPKGVVLTYGNLEHFFNHVMENCFEGCPLVMPFTASVSFDISLFQLLTPVFSGGTCVVVDNDEMSDLGQLCGILKNVNAIDSVPAVFDTLISHIYNTGEEGSFENIKQIFIGGDTIADNLLYRIANVFSNAVVTVTYGPTEGTIFCTQMTYPAGSLGRGCKGAIIGSPVKHAEIYILDASLKLLPMEVVGEICIGGKGVTQGYLNNPGLTNDKFPADPFGSDGLIYRTGDLGRWTSDGRLEFNGRIDSQVKLRGYRVELSEIENVILEYGLVQQAAVVIKTEDGYNKNLIAFVVPEDGFQKQDVLNYLKSRLPGYMIPAVIREVDVMPLTENRKINRKALSLGESGRPAAGSYKPPSSEWEKELCGIWEEFLGKDKIGIADNFFESGGHSLLAMRVATEIQLRLGVKVSVRSIFEFATIRDLAEFIEIGKSNRLDASKMIQTIQL
jgi:amino acid adenylation domain-containing protein